MFFVCSVVSLFISSFFFFAKRSVTRRKKVQQQNIKQESLTLPSSKLWNISDDDLLLPFSVYVTSQVKCDYSAELGDSCMPPKTYQSRVRQETIACFCIGITFPQLDPVNDFVGGLVTTTPPFDLADTPGLWWNTGSRQEFVKLWQARVRPPLWSSHERQNKVTRRHALVITCLLDAPLCLSCIYFVTSLFACLLTCFDFSIKHRNSHQRLARTSTPCSQRHSMATCAQNCGLHWELWGQSILALSGKIIPAHLCDTLMMVMGPVKSRLERNFDRKGKGCSMTFS